MSPAWGAGHPLAAGSRMSARRRGSWEFVDRTVFWLLRWGLCSLASSDILRGSRNSTHNSVKRVELRQFNQDQLRSLTLSTFFPLRLRLPAAVRRRRGLAAPQQTLASSRCRRPEVQEEGEAGWPPLRSPSRRACDGHSYTHATGVMKGLQSVWLASLVAHRSCCWPPAVTRCPWVCGSLHPLFLPSKTERLAPAGSLTC